MPHPHMPVGPQLCRSPGPNLLHTSCAASSIASSLSTPDSLEVGILTKRNLTRAPVKYSCVWCFYPEVLGVTQCQPSLYGEARGLCLGGAGRALVDMV